jgi:hypothetical protein
VDNFGRMKTLFPRCEEYLDHIKLKETDSGRHGIDRLRYLSKKLNRYVIFNLTLYLKTIP